MTIRFSARSIAAAFGLVLVAAWTPPHATAAVTEVAAARITVSDLDTAVRFYTEVLPFKLLRQADVQAQDYARLYDVPDAHLRVARLQLGSETLELVDWIGVESRPIPTDSRSNDRWFQHVAIIVRDMDRAYAVLREHGVQHVSPGPQTLPEWNHNVAGIRAFYFLDPDGHVLEILSFPPDKGDPRWQEPGEALFLGIDHTAIVVDDTETSLGFYRDTLGMRVAGQGENYGAEQERLNSVFAARLHITTLRAERGPGVELLEYLAPPGGRPYPADVRAPDLVYWQTVLVSTDLSHDLRALGDARPPVLTGGAELGFSRSALVRDPDGHVVHVIDAFANDGRASR